MIWARLWECACRTPTANKGDHAKYIPQAQKYALPVYSCQEVADKYKGVTVLNLGEKAKIGGFKVQPIEVPHSCQCYAFLIEYDGMGRMLFCTDCTKFGYRIKNLNHIFIEANWSEELLVSNLCNDVETRSHHEHHMELEDTIKSLKNNYSPDLQTICLLHLSNTNGDPIYFVKRVKEELGFDSVFAAEKDLTIPLQLSEF